MKIKILFVVCLAQLSMIVAAQQPGKVITVTTSVEINTQARRIINSIVSSVGLKSNFEIKAANIPNAAAVVYAGKRYIIYNPQFISLIDKAAGKSWPSIAILAHEIGHHLNGHTLERSESQQQSELDADEFSGFVLQKMGASLKDAQLAIQIAGNTNATHTHPAKSDRLVAIANGWQRSVRQVGGNQDLALQDQQADEITPAPQPVITDKYIAMDVHFETEPTSKYFVTNRNNFVKLNGNELQLLGKMEETGKTAFPLLLFNGDKQIFFIHKTGIIYTAKGEKIGWVNSR